MGRICMVGVGVGGVDGAVSVLKMPLGLKQALFNSYKNMLSKE